MSIETSLPWDFDRFVALSDDMQRTELQEMLEVGSMLHELTDADEFSSAQSETNGAMCDVDESKITQVDVDPTERRVRATFDYSASAFEEQADLGGSLPIRGSAVFVIEADGQQSLEEVHAEAVYPGEDDDEEPDFGDLDGDDDVEF